jgi:hypothetical protein
MPGLGIDSAPDRPGVMPDAHCSMPEPARTIIISDVRLGRPRGGPAGADALRPLWAGADRLVIAGDLADAADPMHRATCVRMARRLQELCRADGIELVLLRGRHDWSLGDAPSIDLADGAVHVAHGDVLEPAASPWDTHSTELAAWNRRALTLLSRRARDRGVVLESEGYVSPGDLQRNRSRLVARARVLASALWHWQTTPARAAEYLLAHRPDARAFVFGHLHRVGIWPANGRALVNIGHHGAPASPRMVLVETDHLRVLDVASGPRGFSLPAQPLLRLPLRPAAATHPAAGPVGSAVAAAA